MKLKDVKVGETYYAKVSGRVVLVRILHEHPWGGWSAVNESTLREVRIRNAQRLRMTPRA